MDDLAFVDLNGDYNPDQYPLFDEALSEGLDESLFSSTIAPDSVGGSSSASDTPPTTHCDIDSAFYDDVPPIKKAKGMSGESFAQKKTHRRRTPEGVVLLNSAPVGAVCDVPGDATHVGGIPVGMALPAVLGGERPPVPKKKPRKKDSDEDSTEDSDTPDRLDIRLPRKTLLAISSDDMTRYAQHLYNTMDLTPGQQAEIKRMKRLVKNRESARSTRKKKVDMTESLKQEIARLQRENDELRAERDLLLRRVSEFGGGDYTAGSIYPRRFHGSGNEQTNVRLSSWFVGFALFSVLCGIYSYLKTLQMEGRMVTVSDSVLYNSIDEIPTQWYMTSKINLTQLKTNFANFNNNTLTHNFF